MNALRAIARPIAAAALACAIVPAQAQAQAQAQEFVEEAWNTLFRTTQLAGEARALCAEIEPALAADIEAAIARLRESHGAEVLAGHAAMQRRLGTDGVTRVARSMGAGFQRRLQGRDAAGQRADCAEVVVLLDASTSRSRQALVEQSFRKWFARKQQEQHIACDRLHEKARALALRFLEASAADASDDHQALRVDARTTEQAAAWCLRIQAIAAREQIRLPGDFDVIQLTARAISDAAMPLLSGKDPAAALALGRQRARRFVEPPPGAI